MAMLHQIRLTSDRLKQRLDLILTLPLQGQGAST